MFSTILGMYCVLNSALVPPKFPWHPLTPPLDPIHPPWPPWFPWPPMTPLDPSDPIWPIQIIHAFETFWTFLEPQTSLYFFDTFWTANFTLLLNPLDTSLAPLDSPWRPLTFPIAPLLYRATILETCSSFRGKRAECLIRFKQNQEDFTHTHHRDYEE